MRKHLLILLCLFLTGVYSFAQTTATDFTVTDCSGTTHHLFEELNAGKVVVISFVMPCGTCIGPSVSAKSVVGNYATSNPGKVLYYIIDDNGGTNCSTLNSWANANGMSGVVTMSSTAVVEAQYGSGGMPKIVVLGGGNHAIHFTQNGGLNTTNLTNAINAAIIATSTSDVKPANLQLSLYPNPVVDKLAITYTLPQASEVGFDVYNMIGTKVKSIAPEKQSAGKQEEEIDFSSLSGGVYFLKVTSGGASQLLKFTVAK